ncbi:hypothetical protein QOT17_022676 [Balamuthia mandrillaris]
MAHQLVKLVLLSFLLASAIQLAVAKLLRTTPVTWCKMDACAAADRNNTCCCSMSDQCAEPVFSRENQISPGVWTILSHFRFLNKVETNNRMILVRIEETSGRPAGMAAINGIELCPDILRSIERVLKIEGLPLRWVISPGDWHYLYLTDYEHAFPSATIMIPPGRIQQMDPLLTNYTLINMSNPLTELLPSLHAISFQGLSQPPPNNTVHRNELVFYHPASRTLIAGDTLFYHSCAAPSPAPPANTITFNPIGKAMILDPVKARYSAKQILALPFQQFVDLHGPLGNVVLSNSPIPATSMVKQALAFLQNL